MVRMPDFIVNEYPLCVAHESEGVLMYILWCPTGEDYWVSEHPVAPIPVVYDEWCPAGRSAFDPSPGNHFGPFLTEDDAFEFIDACCGVA